MGITQSKIAPLAGFLSVFAIGLSAATSDAPDVLKLISVSAEFSLEAAAGEPHIRFPMFATFDDEGRLFVAESSGRDLYEGLQQLTRDCRVTRLDDADGDGRYDQATVFQDQVTFPMGLAWRAGRLYVADPPELVALTDIDGDGRADRREVILQGFGHTDNGSLHGLKFGPDGRLYFTMGEPDGWKLPRGDGTFLEGAAGALFRCRPDGSNPEVISRGFVNLVEVEFMPSGEIIGTDNWYQPPSRGHRDALVDCVPGGLYPYARDRGTPLPRTGILMPPLIRLPAVAHSGLVRPRGTGLPPAWRDSLFVAEHNTRKVTRHSLRRSGSTFASAPEDFVSSESPDFHPSDVLEDADGSLLVLDTGGWYVQHCPTGRIRNSRAPGGIYRVRWKQAATVTDPHGSNLSWSNATPAALTQRVRDSRWRVADRAASELVQRREFKSLSQILESEAPSEVRLRALWSLAQLSEPEARVAVRRQLRSSDPALMCAAARASAHSADSEAANLLTEMLDSPNVSVRRAAAEALAVCGSERQAPRLIKALAAAEDAFEEHACILALLRYAEPALARAGLTNSAPRVRRAALYLLDQPRVQSLRFAELAGALGDDDSTVRAAAEALLKEHPEWAADAVPWLRTQLSEPSSGLRSLQKAAICEALLIAFQGEPSVRSLISSLLVDSAETSLAARGLLLDALRSFTAPGPDEEWLRVVPSGVTNGTLRRAGLNLAIAFPRPEFSPALIQIANDPALPTSERLTAIRALENSTQLPDEWLDLATAALQSSAGPGERLAATDILTRAQLSSLQATRLITGLMQGGTVVPDSLLPSLRRAADDRSRPILAEFFARRLQSGWSPSRETFEVALDCFPPDSSTRASLTAGWEANQATMLKRLRESENLLSGGNPERGRASYETATCSGCHRVGDEGGEIGPDLTRIGAIRSGSDILEAILFPSSSFAQGYEPHRLTTKQGDELWGSLVDQGTAGVSLRDGAGVVHHIHPDDLVSLERESLSAMPEGLEQLLTREQFRDLLAYLQSLK